MNPAAEVLFNYLRDVLANPSRSELDLERLPEDFRELGRGLQYFAECVAETRALASALAKGDLNFKLPPSSNEMAAPLKALYAFLKHIAWQTRQVANGDYTQRVDFMGDFADAFNTMIERLEQQRVGLVRAKTTAEAASEAKSAFLATMSHEIRTPLNTILGLSEIQIQKTLSAEASEYVEKIYGSASSLLGIINDILDISKIEAGGLEIVPADYDVASLVGAAVQLNIVRIASKNVSFELLIDETIPTRLRGDELRLKQILNNLLSNAFKYTEEGHVTLRIDWLREGGDVVLSFAISDTGVGIKREDMGKLFTEYSQLDSRASRNIEGTGLGLAITKHLVDMMGGTITAESEYGSGSVFRVKVLQGIALDSPLGAQAASDLKEFRFMENHIGRSKNLVRSHMPYGRILIVDDVPTNLDVAKGLMLPYGLSIDCASSGREAIERIRSICDGGAEKKYDLVFMDHMMPGMDGIESARIIRGIDAEYARTVPIIMLTANAISGNEDMFLSSGFNAFISKPIDIMKLDAALNKWIRDKQSEETLARAELDSATGLAYPGDFPTRGFAGFRLEGVSLADGVRRYNEGEYLGILRSYVSHTPGLLDRLRCLSEDTLQEYAVTAHGIKGASLGICANALAEKAGYLENAAKAGDFGAVMEANGNFIHTAESLLANLDKLLESVEKSRREALTARERALSPDADLLEKMRAASMRSMTSEMESILTELERYEYESGGELVEWMRERIDNLEYRAVTKRLEGDI
jgi:signal transduction histidine kinase/DNA-binding NarL/FixJ family response regulator